MSRRRGGGSGSHDVRGLPAGAGLLRRAGRRNPVRRWQRYRRRQLELLAESNRLRRERIEASRRPLTYPSPPSSTPSPGGPATPAGAGTAGPAATEPSALPPAGSSTVNVSSPFTIGFLGALGVLTAWLLVSNLTRLSSVLTFLLVAVFLTLALNPLVEGLTRRGAGRPMGVLVVFVGLVGVLGLVGYLVVPPVVQESATLVERAPEYVESVLSQPWVADLDARYGVGERITEEVNEQLTDSGFLATLFGGVLGAAGWVASGIIGVATVLILSLYLLAALPAVKDAAYRAVPASRRPRVIALAEEIMRRVGGYALGQAFVASINGTCSWVVLELLGLPYPVVLAFAVGVLGLIPLVGATLGATIVAAVALFQDPTLALVVIVYYVIYQQVENYVVVPRVMHRTVSVPGAVTVVAVLAGGTLLGVLGALIAIPVAAGLLLLYEEVLVPRQSRL